MIRTGSNATPRRCFPPLRRIGPALRRSLVGILVLGFAFSGAVGIHPTLHRLFEHGGIGADHVHTRVGWMGDNPTLPHVQARAQAHVHPHDHATETGHSHPQPTTPWADLARTPPFVGSASDTFASVHPSFRVPVERFLARCRDLAARLTSPHPATSPDPSAPDEPVPRHRHDSLAQSLADGTAAAPSFACPVPVHSSRPRDLREVPEARIRETCLDPLTAGRGPPPRLAT